MKDDIFRVDSNDKRVGFHDQPKYDENKRVAFYRPIAEGSPLGDGGLEVEKRSLSSDENDDKVEVEKRSAPTSSFESSNPSLAGSNQYDDDDESSVTSAYTYATVDTTATSESVQSIIQRLTSETDRRRRRLMRRRSARNGKTYRKPVKPEDPLKGITVEIRE